MEEWKTINDYPNYSISSLGVIRNDTTKRIMKFKTTKAGYLEICLCKDGIRKTLLHHRLLAIHFIPNPENLPEIDHLNNIKNDNRIGNLRWVSGSQNLRNRKKKTNCSSQ